jgi:5-methylcytosine-specific restriction enzyme A
MRRGGPLKRSVGLKRTAMKRGTSQGESEGVRVCDQQTIRATIAAVRSGETSIVLAARAIGKPIGFVTGRAWRETKVQVKARDGGCVRDGGTQNLDVHHRTPRGMGGTRNPLLYFGMTNLITLCRPCHTDIERNVNREEAFRDGYIVQRGTDPASVPVRVFGRGYVFLTTAGGYLQKEEDA